MRYEETVRYSDLEQGGGAQVRVKVHQLVQVCGTGAPVANDKDGIIRNSCMFQGFSISCFLDPGEKR